MAKNDDGSVGWRTTDAHEIELRRQRARDETMTVVPAGEGGDPVFQDYLVERSGVENPASYRVEIRSLQERVNTCSCPDFIKSGLGTCKHIEKVLVGLGHAAGESPYAEVFMDGEPLELRLELPSQATPALRSFVGKYFDPAGRIRRPVVDTLQVFNRDLASAPPELRSQVRVSSEVGSYLLRLLERLRLNRARQSYAASLRAAAGRTGFLRHPLYDYQIDGMLHLAFTGRAMLADEMGLGKTVQAIAAACVLREHFGVSRVLVVSPASLKTEWEEQIRKFTALPLEILHGNTQERHERYRRSDAFFLLVNYEQVMRDHEAVNADFQPQLVILDEAQRIKNWRAKTATAIKRLHSRFAFVLTGTPLENKIDEFYSLAEFVDPTLFGSLFRFNREFYAFDEDGKVIGHKNLRKLHEAAAGIMLRRRKDEISEQLPDRVDNNYFVELTPLQRERYDEHEAIVAKLFQIAKRRPLLPPEFERLQRALNCMRILCDSVYILDQEITDAPKLDELLEILDDLWAEDPARKVIVFSEWVKMLELARERLNKRGVGNALHVGYVDQRKRRDEINRFKDDPACLVFLSSDSGGVGLNLQAASVVVNLDLPWNPARLEQRVARSWRKHQEHSVNVINLVAANSIEHKMLGTLEFKQGLADAVLDARGDFEDFEKPNAKAAFMERLAAIMESPVAPESAEPRERLSQELQVDNVGVDSCAALYDADSGALRAVLAVGGSGSADKLQAQIEKTHGARLAPDKLAVISPADHALLQKLAALGLITINQERLTQLFESVNLAPPKPSDRKLRLKLCRNALSGAERQLKMADVLLGGGFAEEAAPPARQAALTAALALHAFAAPEALETLPESFAVEMLPGLKDKLGVERSHLLFLQLCVHGAQDDAAELVKSAGAFVAMAAELADRQALEA